MAVSFVARAQSSTTSNSAVQLGAGGPSAGDLILRLVVAYDDAATISTPSGFTSLQNGNLSAHGNGPGKWALFGKFSDGTETNISSIVSTGASVHSQYTLRGTHTTLASTVSAIAFISGAFGSPEPDVAGATAAISKNGALAIFGAYLFGVGASTVGTFAPPNEQEATGGVGGVSSGYSTGLSIGTTTGYGVTGGSSTGQRGTFVIVVRPANTAPGQPGAFTTPTSASVFNGSHTVTHGASTDTEGDTLTYRIEASTNNGASWDHVLATARPGVTGAIDFTSIPATSAAKLRVRAADTDGATSTWRESDVFTIQHNTAPTAATPLSPVGGITVDRTLVELRWQFNDPDAGDTQSRADIRYRVVGAPSWTTVTNAATTGNSYIIPSTLTAGNYEWQVKTWDAAGTEGVWSTSALFTAGNVPSPPTITSHAVDDIIATSTDALAWSGAGDSVQVRKVADDGSGNPNTASVYYDSGTITPGTLSHALSFPVNNRTEHLQVRRTVSGLTSSWASVRVEVDYTPPPTPTVSVLESTPGALTVTIANPAPTGTEPAIDHNDIYRREDGDTGDGIRVATDIAEDGSFIDWAVASGQDYEYLVRAHGVNGTWTDGAWT